MSQHRVSGIELERPGGRRTAGDSRGMSALGAAFSNRQIPDAFAPEKVWGFRIAPTGAARQGYGCVYKRTRGQIDLCLGDASVACPCHQTSVAIPAEIGVDYTCAVLDANGIAPRTSWVIRPDERLTGSIADVGRDHPETAVMVAQRRREDSSRRPCPRHIELRRPVEDIADLFLVPKIAVAKDGNTGKVLEARTDQIVVVIRTADARIGMEARENGPALKHIVPFD